MKKAVRTAVAAVLIMTILAASLFIVLNSHHDHDEKYCRICVCIEAAIGVLKSLASSAALLLCAYFALLKTKERAAVKDAGSRCAFNPILLKVKLNN